MDCADFHKSIDKTDSRRPPRSRAVKIAQRPMATVDFRKFHVKIQDDVKHNRFSNSYFG